MLLEIKSKGPQSGRLKSGGNVSEITLVGRVVFFHAIGKVQSTAAKNPKLYCFQLLAAAVLFPRSQELRRISGRERQKSASPQFRQSRASRKKTRKYWGFLPLDFRRESFAEGLTGGEGVRHTSIRWHSQASASELKNLYIIGLSFHH
jgi:hypothetical protein